MGRPPIGKVAMTAAERVARYRLRHGTVTKQNETKHDAAAAPVVDAKATEPLKARIKELEARIKELEAVLAGERKRHTATPVSDATVPSQTAQPPKPDDRAAPPSIQV